MFYSPCDQTDSGQLEGLFIRALDTLGEIKLIVHSSANEPLRVAPREMQGDISKVNRKLDRWEQYCRCEATVQCNIYRFLIRQDVEGLRRLGHLATKYMGK